MIVNREIPCLTIEPEAATPNIVPVLEELRGDFLKWIFITLNIKVIAGLGVRGFNPGVVS